MIIFNFSFFFFFYPFHSTAFLLAAIIFVLPTVTLVTIYVFLFTLATLRTSFWWSNVFLDKMNATNVSEWDMLIPGPHSLNNGQLSPMGVICSLDFIVYIAVQAMYGFLFAALVSRKSLTTSNSAKYFLIFMLPVLTGLGLQSVFMAPLETIDTGAVMMVTKCLHVLPPLLEIATVFVFSKFFVCRYRVVTYYRTCRYVITNFGIQAFVEDQWMRLDVPSVLRAFWLLRFSLQVLDTFMNAPGLDTATVDDLWNVTFDLATSSCDSSLAVLGLSAVVATVTHHIGALTDKFLGGNSDEVANIGPVSAVLFFILAVQTGLAGLIPSKRFIRLYRNCVLLTTALLHFFHSMVNQVMMTLSTSHSTSVSRHIRALTMCAILTLFPILLVLYLWSTAPLGTWLFAVTAFCMELIIKVVITFIIYVLFLVDTHGDTFWENLDDYVYYIKAFGSTVEFIVGIFLLGNGLWILLMESGGIIRGVMIGIHAYFNIFQLGKDGWKKFRNRRTAVKKINSLPEANPRELGEHNDVCAICYQELLTARITPCGHLFHALCLRKWLYVQDSCPLCHKEIMVKPEEETSSRDSDNEEREQNVDNVAQQLGLE